jgi:acetyltransferase
MSRGQDFFELARSSQKPIVLHKSNRAPGAVAITRSHTAALASDDASKQMQYIQYLRQP